MSEPQVDVPTRPRWSVVAVAAIIALGLGLLGWNVWTMRQETQEQAAATAAVLVTRDQLTAGTAFLNHTVYWAGDQGLTEYELAISGRDVYIRYLPVGAAAGSPDPVLTVATYEKADAYAGLEAAAKVSGATSEVLGGGALVVQPANLTTSAYFAFPGANLLMEVFDPTPGRAYELVRSGVITPLT